jgi:hypothetical protein
LRLVLTYAIWGQFKRLGLSLKVVQLFPALAKFEIAGVMPFMNARGMI